MAADRFITASDEKLSEKQYSKLEEERLVTEAEALQEEIITRIPGIIQLLMKYELKSLTKIIISLVLMGVIYFFVGWDAVASGVILFCFLAVLAYWIQAKHQDRDVTRFVEMKLPGQHITTGDHSPYSKAFYTTEKRFAVWDVPNTLIRRGLFRVPGEQEATLLPGSGKVIFVDLFDRINRTCVLPRDMDVANIAFATNANPLLAEKMTKVGEQIKLDEKAEKLVMDLRSMGKIKASEAKKMLDPIKIRQHTLMMPTGEIRRDIFFELQSIIPQMREKLQEVSNKIFILADFLAAKGIYQSINRPMPEKIQEDHNFLYKVMGLPEIKGSKKTLGKEK